MIIRFIIGLLVAIGAGVVIAKLALSASALKAIVCVLLGLGTMALIKS